MTDTVLLPQKSDIWWIFLLQGFAGIIQCGIDHFGVSCARLTICGSAWSRN